MQVSEILSGVNDGTPENDSWQKDPGKDPTLAPEMFAKRFPERILEVAPGKGAKKVVNIKPQLIQRIITIDIY